MLRKQMFLTMVAGALMAGGTCTFVSAQQENAGQNPSAAGQSNTTNGDTGNNGASSRSRGRGGFSMDQMWQQFKEQLGASDDEWKVLQPKVEKVMQLERDSRVSMFSSMRSSRDRGGDRSDRSSSDRGRSPFGGDPNSPVAKAQSDLQSALKDTSISNEEIAHRLDALRQAREQAKQELTKAQTDLKELLSPRQEAMLVVRGVLE